MDCGSLAFALQVGNNRVPRGQGARLEGGRMRTLGLWIVGMLACPGMAQPQPGTFSSGFDARTIQAQLERTGFCGLPPGEHHINAPIRLGPNQRLSGAGPASILKYEGPGEWAIVFGKQDEFNYGCYLDNLKIVGGGVKCERIGQHCLIERLWISQAPGDGLRVEGIGDLMAFRDIVCWGNKGSGIAVRCGVTQNRVIFDHCSAQANHGHGLLMETITPNGNFTKAVLRDCTFQSNGLGGRVREEVLLRGWITMVRFQNVWIENAKLPVGLRTEASGPLSRVAQPAEKSITRRPGRIVVEGNSTIALMPRSIEFVDCFDCQIEQLSISPDAARVYWKSNPQRGASTYTQPPGGAHYLLDADRLVADPDLK